MANYYIGFLNRGPAWTPEKTEATQKIQDGHMANINRMAELGALVAAGPTDGDQPLRGIFIFTVKTIEEARTLAAADPAIQAGRLTLDLHPWVGPAGIGERYAAEAKANPAMKAVMRTYQLGILKKVAGAQPPSADAQLAHLKHIAAMQAAGKLAAVGQVTDGGPITGVFVFNTDAAEARRLASEDPHVKAGRRTMELFAWWCAEHVMPDKLPPLPMPMPK
jgi:uncharacterized protein YciI